MAGPAKKEYKRKYATTTDDDTSWQQQLEEMLETKKSGGKPGKPGRPTCHTNPFPEGEKRQQILQQQHYSHQKRR